MARFHSQHGTTLIELVASIVIVSIAAIALMTTVSAVVGRSADAMVESQAQTIAEAYLEEIALANFCDPDFLLPGQSCRTQCTASACSAGACGGAGALKEGNRTLYDDICDYDGLNDAGATDRNGFLINELGSYNVVVDVVDSGITLGSPAISANSGEVVRIDVTVTHPGLRHDIEISTFRANAQ